MPPLAPGRIRHTVVFTLSHAEGSPAEADFLAAAVGRGRIASIGGVTALIWLVILVLMVWH